MKNLIVKIDGVSSSEIRVEIKKDLEIGKDIGRELRQAASKFGYYAVLAETAAAKLDETEQAFKVWLAATERELIDENGGKEYKTARMMDRKIRMIPKWSQWQSTLNKRRKQAGQLKQIAKAFELKKDLIQSISANRRAENT